MLNYLKKILKLEKDIEEIFEIEKPLFELKPKEIQTLGVEAKNIQELSVWKLVIRELIRRQFIAIALKGITQEEIAFERGILCGIKKVEEEVEKIKSLYEESIKKGEQFDKYDIV